MLRIGLTGGIASGKSAALARFAQLGAQVIDHDVLAHRAVEPGSAALADIAREFGPAVISAGALDRAALARIVFADASARERLNRIVHPYVTAMAGAAERLARSGGARVVVHDIPLLVETGQGDAFDLVVTVAAPVQLRVERMVAARGMTAAQASARIAAQASDSQRAAVADAVVDGSGTLAALDHQIDAFWAAHVPGNDPSPVKRRRWWSRR